MRSNARACPGCGAVIPQPERPVAVIVFVAICALSAAFILYSLVFRSGTPAEKPRVMLTLTELDIFVPSGWQHREIDGGYVMAQYREDLEVDGSEPENLRGPQIRFVRERQARVNIQREVIRGVLQSDIAGGTKETTYGQASELIGVEVRFVREGVDADVVGYRYYMTGSNPFGQAYIVAYFVPAALERRYEATMKTFLASLALTEEESE
jgi:hypothetical protein